MLKKLLISISILSSFSFLIDNTSLLEKPYNFENVSYYRDIKKIENELKDSSSLFSFTKLLPKFSESADSVSNNEAIALMFGALNHPGYQSKKLDSLETLCDTLMKQKLWKKAIEISDSCESVFPLSVIAIYSKWFASSNLNDSINEDIYHKKMRKIFKAMELTGLNGNLKLSHSKFSITKYLSLVGAGAIFKLENEKLDDYNNQTFYYSFVGFPENFIIPKKK